jgi:uroporphyrinogen-III decarboxylase
MYERMRHLIGFEEMMIAPYTQPDGLEALLDRLTDLTIAIMDQWVRIGPADGFMSAEDWGLQDRLQMKIETFREFYKPRYARLVAAAHERGMHYLWHNCGFIVDMIPDMIEIGVDMVQLDQPRLMGHKRLTDEFGGRISFWNTVDIQWSTSADVSEEDLRAEVAEMTRAFASFNGGFAARHYPQPWDIELSKEAQQTIYEAFLENGCALT